MLLILLALGCASPGPPHAPSLYLPRQVSDLTVQRAGDRVTLRFTAPARSTDNLPLRPGPIHGVLCRQLEHQPCIPAGGVRVLDPSRPGVRNTLTWNDLLPPELSHGPARLLGYRVELLNAAGQSAAQSDVAYTAAGKSPEPIEAFRVNGSRLGIVLQWTPTENAPGEVLLHRDDLAAPSKPTSAAHNEGLTGFVIAAKDAAKGRALDPTAKPETPYRYTAERRFPVTLGGRTMQISSAPSEAVAAILHLTYPPLAPTSLSAAGYSTEASTTNPTGFAVDLIWQPVDDTGLLAGLAGYTVTRQPLDASGKPTADPTQLTAKPVPVPSFHDTSAIPETRYRYLVRAIDAKGNASEPAILIFDPQAHP